MIKTGLFLKWSLGVLLVGGVIAGMVKYVNLAPLVFSQPKAPIIVGVDVFQNCKVDIGYTDNTTDELGVRLYRRDNGQGNFNIVRVEGPHNGKPGDIFDTNLPPGTYEYRVSVYNANYGELFSNTSDPIATSPDCANMPLTILAPYALLPLLDHNPTPSSPKKACTWTPVVNVFLRKGPDVGIFHRLVDVEVGKSFPIIGQSEDGQFWAVGVEPGMAGYITKSEIYSRTSGDCSSVPTLKDPPPPPVIESAPTKKPDSGGNSDPASATQCVPAIGAVCP